MSLEQVHCPPEGGPTAAPAIVVVGFERARALARLLGSLERAAYPAAASVALVISLDGGGSAETRALAAGFRWPHGPLRVIERDAHLGLRRHVLACGDLSEEFGAIIVLEDDLFVSPDFYSYALQALSFYAGAPEVCGISLYGHDYNEYARLRFAPLDDGFDSYFIQTASSWGQLFTATHWKEFREWERLHADEPISPAEGIPQAVAAWPESSWKKVYNRYMARSGRYFVYPRASLSTNFGDAGTHHLRGISDLQVPLRVARTGSDPRWRFASLAGSLAVYDSHFELRSDRLAELAPALGDLDFECDFYGTKDPSQVRSERLLSIRSCTRPEHAYGLDLVPAELNAAFDVPGSFFALAPADRFGETPLRKRALQLRHLHKNAGFKRYGVLALESLRERLAR